MKKFTSLMLVLVMCMGLCVPTMAAEDVSGKERVTITVNTIADVRNFYKSSAYDKNKVYSFVILNHPQSREYCPNCGKAAWTGENYGIDEIAPYPQQCPGAPSLTSDMAVVMYYHYLERCRNCGYEIDHSQYYYAIDCTYGPSFEAWDDSGSRDVHENKDTWTNVPPEYH